ncbi:MAG: 5'-nucleotidase C-terminal domain-containing protein, partial [Chloroflexota bacterium]
DALREIVPIVWEAGADMIVVPTHICRNEISSLANAVTDLGISLIGGGHCNERFTSIIGETLVISGGAHLSSFAWADIQVDTDSSSVEILDYGTEFNRPGNPNPQVAALVEEWHSEAEAILDQQVGFTSYMIPRRSETMQQLIVESWLLGYPTADVALTNTGGIRADFRAGQITFGDVITVLPFANTIIELHLTGDDLIQELIGHRGNTAIAGMKFEGSQWINTNSGMPIDLGQIYVVLVNSFMYSGGDGYNFAVFDPDGYDTAIHYRQPLLDWINAQGTSEENPIDDLIKILVSN